MRRLLALSMGVGLSLMAGITVGETELKHIVVDGNAAPTAKLAASNLQEYVEKVSGAKLDIVEKAPEERGNIFVGERADMVAGLKPEGYRIVAKDGNVYITGRDNANVVYGIRNPWRRVEVYNEALKLGAFGEAGTLYGVNNFLEKYAGVRFYWPGELGTVVPKKDIKVPAKLDEGNYPKFRQRHIWICNFNEAPEDALWYRRIGLGAKAPVQIIDYNYFLTGAFKDKHPEYLALVDGVRDDNNKCASRGGGSLCYTAPGCREAVAELIIDFFRKHPEHDYFPLVPGDGYWRTCECENCVKRYDLKAEALDPGKFSYHVWEFVDAVAKIVGKEFPDKYVGCLAYESFLVPPKEIDKLSPNVAVMFCKNRSTMASPAYAKEMHRRIEDWKKKVSSGLFTWDYYLHCWKPWSEMPVFFMDTIQKDIRYEVKNGFWGEFIEAESWQEGKKPCVNFPATQHLNLYVTGKLYWNPNLNMKALLDEYYELFYGPAAKPMKAFVTTSQKFWNDANKRNKKTTGIFEAVSVKDVFDHNKMQLLKKYLDQALKAAPEGSQYRARVEQMAKEFATGAQVVDMMTRKLPEADVVPTSDTIVIDGKLIENAWKGVKPLEMVAKDGLETPHKSKVLACHDNDNLYIAFELQEKKTDKLKLNGKTRDFGDLYLDDCIEFYVTKDRKKMGGYQFIVNAAGILWDASINENSSRNPDWNSAATSAAAIYGDKIFIELSIPLVDIGLKAGDAVFANFYRSRVVDERQEFACWSPVFKHSHLSPDYFGTLTIK
ncbi:MAG: DUF4838 domain-containing protein [Victivallales bacterium]|nr:DUF4838 domain-containing protein [Victivallales bacterium]